MKDTNQLPHLLSLLEDDSVEVTKAVGEALVAFGPTLKWALAELPTPPTAEQLERIHELIRTYEGEPIEGDEEDPEFIPGELVRHKRYGYRGVVVASDSSCQAEDKWYFSNQTQPNKNQSWYHVLVHDSKSVTYAAQSSLEVDESGEQVSHPYVSEFFEEFADGYYIRNSRPWTGRVD
jgi:heat shock protein HspQ